MAEEVSAILKELREGICLATPHGSLIYSGEQTSIILPRQYKAMENSLVYLIEDNLCYGIIRLHRANKIGKDEFKELSEQHKITEDERDKWWPNKEVLFSYDFDVLELFMTPRRVEIPFAETDTFVTNFDFSTEQEMIRGDIKAYEPQKQDIDVLRDDWRIVSAWYSTKMEGKPIKHSLEDILHLAKIIYEELVKRGTEFHPDTMTPHALDLFKKVSGKSLVDLNDPSLLNELEDKTIIKDFISVVGSYAEHKKDPHDVDLLIRMREPTDYLKRAIEVRLKKDVGFNDRLHFIWGDTEGPHDTFIPLYDLQLKRVLPMKVVKMQQMDMATLTPFQPMKPAHRFYLVEDILPFLAKLSSKFAVEKKFDGFRILIIKAGSVLKIYSEHKRDVTEHFPNIVHEAKQLSHRDFILDCELVYKEGGRSQLINYFIGSGKHLDDTLLTAWAFDVVSFDGEDVSDQEWFRRKGMLHQLHFSKHIKEVHSIIVDSPPELEKAINFTKQLPGSEGAMIKTYTGKYKKDGETDAWVKFRNEDALNVKVMEVHQESNGYSYRMGISTVSDAEKFQPDYLADDKSILLLGNTFVTKLKFAVGDIIKVMAEEVWKHIYPQQKIRFSVHKPKVIGKAEGPLMSWRKLDELASSKGQSVKEFCEECEMAAEPVEIENHVVKRGNKWCVVHGHPKKAGSKTDKPAGSVIKCFPTEKQAKAMHTAIIISEARRAGKLNQNYPVPESDWRMGMDDCFDMAIPEDDEHRQYDFNCENSQKELAQPHNDAINSGSNRNYDPITGEQLDEGGEYGVTAPGGIRGGGTVAGDIADVQGKVWKKAHVKGPEPNVNNTKSAIKPEPHVDEMPKHDKNPALPPGLQDTFSGIGEKKTSNPLPALNIPDNVPPRLQPESTPAWYGLSENAENEQKDGSEGGEVMINDFPERMQQAFQPVMDQNQWKEFVVQWHLRGEKSIHTDMRLDVGDHLEGFTMFTPGGIEGEDLLDEQPHNIRGTIKLPQPREWLKIRGGFKAGAPGTTTNHSAYFAIVAKGKYRPIMLSDHIIKLELATDHGACLKIAPIQDEDRDFVQKFNSKLPENLKELNGYFEFHIAHIEDRHIILFDKVHSS